MNFGEFRLIIVIGSIFVAFVIGWFILKIRSEGI